MGIVLGDKEWEDRECFGAGFIRRVNPQVVVKVPDFWPIDIDGFLSTNLNQMEALEWFGSDEASGFIHIRKEDWIGVNPNGCIVSFPAGGGMIEHTSKLGEIITYTFSNPETAFMFRLRFT